MKDWLKSVDTWWFGKGDPTALGVVRALCGFYAAVNLALLSRDFGNFYGPKGFFTPALAKQWQSYPFDNILFRGTSAEVTLPFNMPRITAIPLDAPFWWTVTVYVITVAAAVGFMLGWRTRITGILLALGMTSLHLRTPVIIHSGDTLLRLMIIYLAFGSSGAAFSLDARGKALQLVSLWPQRLIQFQIALCYFITAWLKWTGDTWRDGTATWYPSQLNEFDRFPVPAFFEQQPMIGITTYGTLIVEVALATLVFWRPLRKWVLLAGVAMHAYIEYRFNIPFFATTIVTGYIAFYDGEEVAAWMAKMRERWEAARASRS